eukprot:scaffold15156_cov14-Tisochrysis_lutea.AAC.1
MAGDPATVHEKCNARAEVDSQGDPKARGSNTEGSSARVSVADAGKRPGCRKQEGQVDRLQKKQADNSVTPVEQGRGGDVRKAGAEGDKLQGRCAL